MRVWSCSIVLYFILLQAYASCEILRGFLGSIKELHDPMQLTVVFSDILEGLDPELCVKANCLGYSDTEINQTVTVMQENMSQNEQGWSWAFIGRNSKLLRQLSRKFFAQQGMVFVPLDEMQVIADKLRLDNNVVFYTIDTAYDRVNLIEVYTINNEHPIKKELGFWNYMDGLKITKEGIWDRRSDLMGVILKNLVKR